MRAQQLRSKLAAKMGELDRINQGLSYKVLGDEDLERIQILSKEISELKAHLALAGNHEEFQEWSKPVNPLPFSGGRTVGESAIKSHSLAYTSVSGLRNIDVAASRQENEELAYKFFKWFCATSLPPNSDLQRNSLKFCEQNGLATIKALGESTNELGGSLVPSEFDPMLIRLIERFGLFRGFTRVVPMSAEVRIQPRRKDGVEAVWVGEGRQIAASDPEFDNVQLVAKKLAALTVISSEITEDAALSIADTLAFEIGYAFALAEDRAAFLGDATSTFGGITGICPKLKGLDGTIGNIAGLVIASGNLFSEFVMGDFIKVAALLPEYADGPNAGWYCHRSFYYGTVLPLILDANGAEAREIMAGDRRPRPMFLGYPVNFCQVMPKTDANSQIPILLGDIAMGSMLGDRRQRTIFTDPYSLSNFDQIQVRGTERIDINIFGVGNASATPSLREPGPIVGLISAAS